MDDEVEISSGTDTDEDGALIEKARQAAESKRAPAKKRGPASTALAALSNPTTLLYAASAMQPHTAVL